LQSTYQTMQQSFLELQARYEIVMKTSKELEASKAAFQEEMETLSQALFEEANKMVADERKRCSIYEEELAAVKAEREALMSTLKVVEGENGHLREISGRDRSNASVAPGSSVG